MGPVIKAVNFIRARGLNHWQLQKFLEDLETEHQDLAYFSEVHWLSKDSTLQRFYELRKEVVLFSKSKGRPMAEMKDKSWVSDLAFLIDTTTRMNELNTKLQQKAQYVSEMYGHIKGFTKQVETLARTHTECKSRSLSNFKRNGNASRKEDRICRSTSTIA